MTQSISIAATRPPPFFLRSVCATTPFRDSLSIARICACLSAGNCPIILSMVLYAVVVCRVPKTRWPVSAVSIAISTVSKSRISPISMMSGSSRSAARSAFLNPIVCLCTSLWLIRQFLFLWTNSTGSSIVIMWALRFSLMRSTMAARVVDFPLPVGPVTTTRPLFNVQKFRTHSGSPSCSAETIFTGIFRMTEPTPFRSMKTLTLKRASPFISYAKSESKYL